MSEEHHKQNWFARHKIITGIVAAFILIGIGGALGQNSNQPTVVAKTASTKSTNSTASSTGSSGSSSTGSSSTSSPSDGHVGDTMEIGGNTGLDIKLTNVIKPATGDPDDDSTPDPGKNFVAVELTITNEGTSSYSDDANSDVSVIGSDNQTYTFDVNDVTECTNFDEGDYTLSSGESASGCVVFQLPSNVTVSRVQFTDESAENSGTAEWIAN